MYSPRSLRLFRAAGVLALALSTIAATSEAAMPRWERATPFGGSMVSLAQAPSAPQTLYALSAAGSLFRSLDGGATWSRRTDGVRIDDDYIVELVADPHDSSVLYARGGAYRRFYRTRDAGLTWSRLAVPPSEEAHVLSTDPNHPGVLFAANTDGLYRSNDGGDSWVLAAFGGSRVIGVSVDPRSTDTLLVVIEGNETEPTLAWKSTDRGATWSSSVLPSGWYSGLPRFVFDPVRPEVLYLFFADTYPTAAMILRSADGGATWSGRTAWGMSDLTVAPDGTLLAATEEGLERSGDGGANWIPPFGPDDHPPAGPPFDSLARILASSTPGELFAAGGSGIWKSGDNGATWALSNQGILAQGAGDVAVSPGSAVLALAGDDLFRSANQGTSWTRIHARHEGPWPEGLKLQPDRIEAFDRRHPGTIYGIDTDGQADFLVASTNGGREWAELEISYTCGGDSICGVSLTTVALGSDGSIFAGGSYYFHYVGAGDYLVRSQDGGQSWKDLSPLAGIGDFAVDPKRRDHYNAVTCAGLFRSTDAGRSWKETGRGLPSRLCLGDERRPVLAVDPRDSRRLYVGTLTRGVYSSSDGGMTLRAMNRGLETAAVRRLLIDPTDSSKLYAGVQGKGVFQWDEEQRKWTPLNRGLPLTQFAGTIALDPRQPSILYATSPIEGVFRIDLEAEP